MIVKTVREPDDLVQGTPEDLERLRAQAKDLPLTRILYSLDLLGDTLGRLSRTAFKRTELEMAVVRLCDEQMGGGLEALGERLEKLERAVRTGGPGARAGTGRAARDGAGAARDGSGAHGRGTPRARTARRKGGGKERGFAFQGLGEGAFGAGQAQRRALRRDDRVARLHERRPPC